MVRKSQIDDPVVYILATQGRVKKCHMKDGSPWMTYIFKKKKMDLLKCGLTVVYEQTSGQVCATIEGKEYYGYIRIANIVNGHLLHMPYTRSQLFCEIIPQLSYLNESNVGKKQRVGNYLVPDDITQYQKENWQKFSKKNPDEYELYQVIMYDKTSSIGKLSDKYNVSIDEIREATDEALEKFGCL